MASPPTNVPLAGPRDLLPRGSVEYAATSLEELRFRWASVRDDERRFDKTLAEIEAARIFEHYPPEQPYGDLDALCRKELGVPLTEARRTIWEVRVDRAQALAADAPVLLGNRGPATKEEKPIVYERNNRLGGDSADYLTARIARDHPAILEKMRAGAYPSVRAAALDAGIVRQRVSILPTVDGFRRAIEAHLSSDDIEALIGLLQ
jgi:hypothetical protein